MHVFAYAFGVYNPCVLSWRVLIVVIIAAYTRIWCYCDVYMLCLIITVSTLLCYYCSVTSVLLHRCIYSDCVSIVVSTRMCVGVRRIHTFCIYDYGVYPYVLVVWRIHFVVYHYGVNTYVL